MPIDYLRDDPRRRIRVTASDPLTVVEGLALVDRQVADGAWTYGMLYDATLLSDPLSMKDVTSILAHIRTLVEMHGRRGPIAIVSRAARVVGKSQAYANLGAQTGLDIEVFWDTDEAERWLDTRLAP